MQVPFFRPNLSEAEFAEVNAVLRSGWLTTGPRTATFETEFAAATGGKHAIALNSCTAALHLAVEALGLGPGHAVLVPTMTFAATAEIVRYMGAVPVMVDCEPTHLLMDLADAERKIAALANGELGPAVPASLKVVGIIPVHVGGVLMDMNAVSAFAKKHGLWVVEDAAHSFPAAWRANSDAPWQRCGENTSDVACFSFYANKTITTGEGGMAVTDRPELAERMRLMSLHGLSQDAWKRYSGGKQWDYRIVAPGFKYNLTDIASAIGIHQTRRAESLRVEREQLAALFTKSLGDLAALKLPPQAPDRVHSWHLYPVRLNLAQLRIDRNKFVELLKERGVGCSVHWRPLHLHTYYQETFLWKDGPFPVSTREWERLVSLPLFPGMTPPERDHVLGTVRALCTEWAA